MKLGQLRLSGWRQFEEVKIDFDPNLTILVGTNGSGKSTILNVLASLFDWHFQFVNTTENRSQNGSPVYSNGIHRKSSNSDFANNQIGSVALLDMPTTLIPIGFHHNTISATSSLGPLGSPRPQLKGVHIPSCRSSNQYQRIGSLPTVAPTREAALSHYSDQMRNQYGGGGGSIPLFHLKQDVSALAVYGFGNSVVASDSEALAIFEGFSRVLQQLFPKELKFQKIEIRHGDVVFLTASGAVNLEALSDGLQSIINMAWQIFLLAGPDGSFIATIDEPEAHFHTSIQRQLLPKLLAAFPNVQFVVSTHSPAIALSVKNAPIYALAYADNGLVNSKRLPADVAGISDEAMREILGLESALALI